MIDDKTKQKLLKELEKTGNVGLSCSRAGVNRSTYYRWCKEHKRFKKVAGEKLRRGRETNVDIAEQSLMLCVKDKNLAAIKYLLSHNSRRYRPKTRRVIIDHNKASLEEGLREEYKRKYGEITDSIKDLIDKVGKVTRKSDVTDHNE